MNKPLFRTFIINTLVYTLIVFSLYFLYSRFNTHPNNTGSSVKFIYQQF